MTQGGVLNRKLVVRNTIAPFPDFTNLLPPKSRLHESPAHDAVSSRLRDGSPKPESTATVQQSSKTKLAKPKPRERRQAQSAR